MKKILISNLFIMIIVVLFASGQSIKLPQPGGPYAVGTQYLFFVDVDRYETFTENPDDKREITVKAWYPAEKLQQAISAPYLKQAEEMVTLFNLPVSYLNAATHSVLDAPVLKEGKSFPVLIFNHGWGEFFSQNTVLMEELASHGYIVLSLAHHYECKFSFYPDGRTILLDGSGARFRKILSEQRNPLALELLQRIFNASDDLQRTSVFVDSTNLLPTFFTQSPRLWTSDIQFLIDRITHLDVTDALFAEEMDLGRIGVFGMSMGGISAQHLCAVDKRCRAGISMDGGFYGDSLHEVISVPFLFINSYRYIGYEKIFLDHTEQDGFVLTIPNADHYNFHDIALLDSSHPLLGDIDAQSMLDLLNESVLNFFDAYLKNEKEFTIPSLSRKYPEVVFVSKQ